jgi:hypothetical protein
MARINGASCGTPHERIHIKHNTLYLKIDSSVMREELLNGKQIIIERVNKEAGCQLINDIWFS